MVVSSEERPETLPPISDSFNENSG